MSMGDLKEILWMVSPEECQALQDICEYNDITEKQLVSCPESIRSVEMFMHNLSRICCMSFFPNLVSLSLIQQNISTIEGLHNCPYLETLRLSENKIQRIEGLDGCQRLKGLFLQSNCITQIRNLGHLKSLEVLWLADNAIKQVEGLECLGTLRELNLASTCISQLGEIVNLKLLEHLNLSATSVGSFKEIGKLTRLKNLKDLRFSDPNWGESPISTLHNYQTYVLYRLHHLQSLDSHELDCEAKQAAKATYARKRVYYNMCIKSLQLNKDNISTLAIKNESKRAKGLQRTLIKLVKVQKDLNQQMRQASEFCKFLKAAGPKTEDVKWHGWWSQMREAKVDLETQILHAKGRLEFVREEIHAIKAREKTAVDRKIHWLKVELDTGGNIRMEIGNPKDIWFKNCQNLIVSRFSPIDYASFGITGVRVLKVIRIHNRFLQDRWEKSYEAKAVRPRKRYVEYLLYGEGLQSANEFQCIIEEGFPFVPGQQSHGCQGPVLLSNSIGIADVRRLQVIAEEIQSESFWRFKATGWLLVVKAYLGFSVQDLSVNSAPPLARKSTHPGADSVYRLHPTDTTQRSWFVFDSTLVVPEYLVEFQYNYKNKPEHAYCENFPIKQKPGFVGNGDESDESGNWHCIPFGDPTQVARELSVQVIDADGNVPDSCANEAESPDYHHISGKSITLCSDLILKNSKAADVSKITCLNLHNNNISDIKMLKGLEKLEVLELSFNKIVKIKGLDSLKFLKKLDLSYNLVKRIEGLSGLESLAVLHLAGNEIWCTEDLKTLHSQVPGLLELSLENNPLDEHFGYREMVIEQLPSVSILDSIPVLCEPRTCQTVWKTFALQNSFSAWKFTMPSAPCMVQNELQFEDKANRKGEDSKKREYSEHGLERDLPQAALEDEAETVIETMACPDELEELNFEGQGLKSTNGLGKFWNLRRLILSHNSISTLEGLEVFPMLEELMLDNNNLQQVNCSPKSHALWKLDVSNNALTSCESFTDFGALTQLSVEKNNISSLKGLSSLACLMELYAANNQLFDMREIAHLRDLPKLMVLDLSGNAICKCPEYRTYSIFSMKKLKVLDGRIINNSELAEARNKHTGRLTTEMLEEYLGLTTFSQLEVLDLSSRSLRHCGHVFESGEFRNLVELNLNSNLLSSVQGLGYLQNLLILRLENNNIDNGPLLVIDDKQLGLPPPVNNTALPIFDAMKYVEILELGKNGISSIDSLHLEHTFQHLKFLSLQHNKISKIDGIKGLRLLEKLFLDHNSIKEIDPLALSGLSKLKELHLSDNLLRNVASIESLPSLEILNFASNYLTCNRLGGLSSVDNLASLPSLIDLRLLNNPISRQIFYRVGVISKLKRLRFLDGKEVLEDERDEAEALSIRGKEASASSFSGLEPNSIDSSMAGQTLNGKIPLKVTSLSFEAMCGGPLSSNGKNLGSFNIQPVSRQWDGYASGNRTEFSRQWDGYASGNRTEIPLYKSRTRDESKMIVVPLLFKEREVSSVYDG